MSSRNRWMGFALVITLACLFPISVQGQCVTTSIMQSTSGMTIHVTKTLSTTPMCTLTMMMAVGGCSPTGTATTAIFSASANTAVMSPSCAWLCACGSVVIDGSDGLPVELMDFGIEEEGKDVDAEEEGEPGEDEGRSAQSDSS